MKGASFHPVTCTQGGLYGREYAVDTSKYVIIDNFEDDILAVLAMSPVVGGVEVPPEVRENALRILGYRLKANGQICAGLKNAGPIVALVQACNEGRVSWNAPPPAQEPEIVPADIPTRLHKIPVEYVRPSEPVAFSATRVAWWPNAAVGQKN